MKKIMNVINALFSGAIFMAPKCALWAIGGMSLAAFLEQNGVASSTYKMVALIFVLIGVASLALSIYNGVQDDKKSALVAAQWRAEAAAQKQIPQDEVTPVKILPTHGVDVDPVKIEEDVFETPIKVSKDKDNG